MPFLSLERVTFEPERKMTHEDLLALVGESHSSRLLGGSARGVVHEIRSFIQDEAGNVISAELLVQL